MAVQMRSMSGNNVGAVFILLIVGSLIIPIVTAGNPEAPSMNVSRDREFIAFVKEYADTFYRYHPVRGPEFGIHTYDRTGLDNMSPASLAAEDASLVAAEERLAQIPKGEISPPLRIDYDRVHSNIAYRRDELEITKTYTKNPYYYADIIQVGLLFQILFDYPGTTRDSRLITVLAQLDSIPPLMDNARLHLQAVSPELNRYGITSLEDTKSFISTDIRNYFAGSHLPDGSLADPILDQKIAVATASIDRLIRHLETLERRPGEKPSFALGESGLYKRFTLKEGLVFPENDPFTQVSADLYAELNRSQAQFKEIAAEIDPGRDPRQVWAEIEKEHPSPGELVDVTQHQVDVIRQFLSDADIISLPGDEDIRVQASPPFMISWMATAWSTGPFEGKPAPQAVYYVSDPKGILPDDEGNEFLKNFVTAEMWSTCAHEAYPGHFVQGYALKRIKENDIDTGSLSLVPVSNIFAPFSYYEGWAVYSEQMINDAGFRPGPDRLADQKYRLGQLSDKIYRLAGAYAGIQMHRGTMDVEGAREFIENNSYTTPEYAAILAERAAYEPDFILYAIGSLEFMKIRDEYKAAREAKGLPFSYREYHDKLLSLGQYPLPVIRQKMHDDVESEQVPAVLSSSEETGGDVMSENTTGTRAMATPARTVWTFAPGALFSRPPLCAWDTGIPEPYSVGPDNVPNFKGWFNNSFYRFCPGQKFYYNTFPTLNPYRPTTTKRTPAMTVT